MKAFNLLNISSQVELVLLLATVFVCSLLGTAVMRYLGGRYGWVVMPRADRWHKAPTALHGGVGFFPAFLLGAAWLVARNDSLQWSDVISLSMSEETRLIGALLSGSFLMFLFGWWDDLKQCRPATKLVFQLVAASLFISAGGVFPLTGIHSVDVLVTYFWFIGITNAVNMLDNMDGLASGVVILAAGTLIVLATGVMPSAGQPSFTVGLGLVFVTVLLGFWFFNRPPASIFMGDSGSLFIGYGLAGLAVPSSLNGFMGINTKEMVLGPVFALLIPATVLAVPIFDTTLVTITRKWKALKATEGGRDHSSHRLVGLGLSEKRTVWLLYSFAAFGGTMAVIMQRFSQQALPLLGLFVIILILSGVYLGHVKVQRRTDVNRMPPAWTPLVTELFYKRRAAEVLLDTVLIVICFYGAYLLRFDGALPSSTEQAVMVALPLIVPSCLIVYFLSGMYRGQWRLISVSDVPCYTLGVFGGAVLSLASVTLITRFPYGHSRSAYIIFGLLAFVAIVGSRLSFRLLDSVFAHNHSDAGPNGRKLVLIYGAARAGKILHDELTSNPELRGYSVIGFIDNDHHLNGRRLCGIPVRSESEWIGQDWHCIPEIWISSKFISDQQGQALAQNWSGMVTVRRVQLHMETIEDAQEQAGPCVLKAIGRDRETFHAKLDAVALHTVSQVEHASRLPGHA